MTVHNRKLHQQKPEPEDTQQVKAQAKDEIDNENPSRVEFSGNPEQDPAAEVLKDSRHVQALPPSSTLRRGNEDAEAISEAFLDLEATTARPEEPNDQAYEDSEDVEETNSGPEKPEPEEERKG